MNNGAASPPTTKLRILHVLPDLALGGGQVIVANLVAAPHPDLDHVVAVLGGGPARERFETAGVPIVDCGGVGGPPLAALRLARLIRRNAIDVVHTNNTPTDRLAGLSAALLTRTPVVNTQMAIATSHLPRRPGESWGAVARRRAGNLANRALARVGRQALCALSATVARSHAEALRLPLERIAVVVPGLPHQAPPCPADVRTALALDGCYPVLVSVGRVEPNKGQLDLVPLLATVVAAWPTARLLVVGDGPDRAELERRLSGAGLAGHAAVLGRRHDVPALLEAADIFVSTAHHEGFGMAALEALAAGCAVAGYSNDAVALAEFVDDGVDGRLTGENPDDLAAAVLELVADPARLAEMAAAARRKAARFGAASTAAAQAQVYARLTRR
jgi:glycosyltransferase involved in cell wall biosynthesis